MFEVFVNVCSSFCFSVFIYVCLSVFLVFSSPFSSLLFYYIKSFPLFFIFSPHYPSLPLITFPLYWIINFDLFREQCLNVFVLFLFFYSISAMFHLFIYLFILDIKFFYIPSHCLYNFFFLLFIITYAICYSLFTLYVTYVKEISLIFFISH